MPVKQLQLSFLVPSVCTKLFFMKVAALISGGKDSVYSIMQCIKNGHQVVVLVNLTPESPTVGKLSLAIS